MNIDSQVIVPCKVIEFAATQDSIYLYGTIIVNNREWPLQKSLSITLFWVKVLSFLKIYESIIKIEYDRVASRTASHHCLS